MQCASCDSTLDSNIKTCYICKRSVHPTCMQASSVALSQGNKGCEACQMCINSAQKNHCRTASDFIPKSIEVGEGGSTTYTTEKIALTMQHMYIQHSKLDGICEIKKSVEYLALQHDKMMVNNSEIGKAMEEMNNTVQALKEQINSKDNKIIDLIDRVNDVEQQSLDKTIEIHGLQQNTPEDIRQVVVQLGGTLGLKNAADSIDDVYRRCAGYGGRPPVVVLKLQTVAARNKWMELRNKFQTMRSDNTGKHNALFINEALTYANRGLLKKVKEIGKEKNYKYVWTRVGQIFVRKDDMMGRMIINNESDAIRKIV